jgi:hypothetical protein
MAFSAEVLIDALLRSEDVCECTSNVCGVHICEESLHEVVGWVAWRTDPESAETLDNCEAICPACAKHRENAG